MNTRDDEVIPLYRYQTPPTEETVTKRQGEITRDEWIVFQWLDITTMGQTERHYVRGMRRDISEAEQAARDFDIFSAARDALNKAPGDEGYQPEIERA